MNTTLADQLKAWRAAQGLSQERAAVRVGVTVSTWCNWERAKTQPSRMAREKLLASGVAVNAVNNEKGERQ